MIVEKALALAGHGAVPVHRPGRRVAHVYVGPLTPSGRYVPRAGQTVCRARTRRLSVLPNQGSSLEHRPTGPCLVCARCSARLEPTRRAEQSPTTRAALLAAYAGTTVGDVAFALELALTPAEVDAAAHLSLLLFDVAGCNRKFLHHGQTRSLHQLVHQARRRVGGFPESHRRDVERSHEISEEVRDQRRRETKAAYAAHEQHIENQRPQVHRPTKETP